MNAAISVLCALAIALALYFFVYMMAAFFAENEIEKSEFVKFKENRVEIFANYENLEYYIRCSIFACRREDTPIVVNISRQDRHFDENLYIAECFAKKHGNIRIRLI